MNTTDNSPMEDVESAVSVSVTELQQQLTNSLKQLSPRLRVLADECSLRVQMLKAKQ